MVNYLSVIKLIYIIIITLFPIPFYWFVVPVEYLYIFYWISFAPILFVNIIVFTEIIAACQRCFCNTIKLKYLPDLRQEFNFAVLIPAYFPNEHNILNEILNHYQLIIYNKPDKINLFIFLIYNSKAGISLEEKEREQIKINELKNLHPNIYVCENIGSKSKAENINYGITILENFELPIDIVSVFDADHKPDLFIFNTIAKIFTNNENLDILQGRCAVRYDHKILSKIIAIEFAEIYSLYHNGGDKIRRFGIFGGSNGHWRYNAIKDIKFNPNMLTEDIDSSMRALSKNYNIHYCNDIISYELAPPNIKSLYYQRLRWAQGWAEVTWHNILPLMKSDLSIWKKICLFMMLPFREIYYYLTMHIGYIGIIYLIKNGFNFWPTYLITGISSFLILLLMLKCVFIFLTSNKCQLPGLLYLILYSLLSIPYEIFKIYIVYCAHIQFLFKERTWRTTPR